MVSAKPKTIILVFIHGFKGDDTTFSQFPAHLSDRLSVELALKAAPQSPVLDAFDAPPTSNAPAQVLSSQLPSIIPLLYPSFETRGDLSHTVGRLRAWLLEKVIDAEVGRGTPSPTVSPGVGVVLVGHSMGGIVAADAVLGIANEFWDEASTVQEEEREAGIDEDKLQDVDLDDATRAEEKESEGSSSGTMFPKVLGVLAYDTPYLGIAPGVVKYGVEEQYRQGKSWYDGASGMFAASKWAGLGGSKEVATETGPKAADGNAWISWGKAALLASAGIAAAGGVAYAGRQHLGTGFNWVSSHLTFVGCLAREQDLRKRFAGMVTLTEQGNHPQRSSIAATSKPSSITERIGFAIFYTILDPKATALPDQTGPRTFCRLPRGAGRSGVSTTQPTQRSSPPSDITRSSSAPTAGTSSANRATNNAATDQHWRRYWVQATNSKAANEVGAHVAMFDKAENPEYKQLLDQSADAIARWTEKWALD